MLRLRVQKILFVICLEGINGVSGSYSQWYPVPDLSTLVGYAVLGEIDSSVWNMKGIVFSTLIKDRIDSRRQQVVISFPKKFSRGQLETLVKAKKVVRFEERIGIITFLHKVHNTYSFTLLSFDRESMGFVCVAPDRETVVDMRLDVGIVCVDKDLFWNIVSDHGQYCTSLNQS